MFSRIFQGPDPRNVKKAQKKHMTGYKIGISKDILRPQIQNAIDLFQDSYLRPLKEAQQTVPDIA